MNFVEYQQCIKHQKSKGENGKGENYGICQ